MNNIPKTPKYEYNLRSIEANYLQMCQQLSQCDKVFYALKANSEIEILRTLKQIGAGFEIASIGELHQLVNLGISPDRIICSLPIKPIKMIEALYSNGCRYFTFDHIDEYAKFKMFPEIYPKMLRIFISDILPDSINYGMTFEEFETYYSDKNYDLEIDGITFYANPNLSIDKFELVLDRCRQFLEAIGDKCLYLNIGGNFRLANDLDNDYYIRLNSKLASIKKQFNKLTLYAEPGRSIVKSAGDIITKIELVKKTHTSIYVYIDAGIPTGLLYPPRNIVLESGYRPMHHDNYQCKFFDITCTHKLLFSQILNFKPQIGDILRLTEMGTYSLCKANRFHLWDYPTVEYL